MNTENNTPNNTPLETVKKMLGALQDAYTMMILTASMLNATAEDIKKTVKEVGINVLE